ncbi:Type II secretory pathway, ATPase PulE/Tfp pilus assembly pathway, ATPase PilB [Serratia fonticola]|uniref:type IV pilus twitching motility protein PilT n=1 Tax=Serratia fonticola TaxID=47917 RepID=UPI001C467D98|nr:type IV pilus twitching motility protein PilT [Serratia fonticola]QXN64780.1 type IV pilus twitching motility protein PilT [Serratia fonticola]CAI0767326.1 Type II secretory pathway, ATPase PulE/Tfp pilus assembly pathway, ATPase PilB [Serratia fonticola]
MDIDEFVALSVKHNASDLHLCTGHLPMLRIDGELQAVERGEILTQQQMSAWCQTQLSQMMWQQLQQVGQLDLALSLADGTRLRANFFLQNAGVSVALRRIASQCPTLAELTTPEIIPALLQREDGLILVTGATGSGKSTTLAAMIDFINRHQRRHILTLEDPIEFIHRSQRSLIQQRELGRDTHSFDDALRAALREDPDVILLGELRDTTTVRLALTAAETGHLVLATLHTRSAPQAVERLVDVFPAEEKAYVRAQLASSLQAVIAQKLLSKPGGGRVAIYEILTATAAVSSMIREGKTHQLVSVLQTGAQSGMQTFEQGLQQRVAQGIL